MTEYAYNTDGELVDATDLYDDYLDAEGEVEVAGLSFYPSRIIRELDPTAYRCGFSDYMDGMKSDGEVFDAVLVVLTEDGEVEDRQPYREVDDARYEMDNVIAGLDFEYIWTVQVVDTDESVVYEQRVEKSA